MVGSLDARDETQAAVYAKHPRHPTYGVGRNCIVKVGDLSLLESGNTFRVFRMHRKYAEQCPANGIRSRKPPDIAQCRAASERNACISTNDSTYDVIRCINATVRYC